MTHASSDLHWESSQVVPPYLSIIRFFYTYPHWHRSEPTGYEALDPLPLDSGLAWSEEVSSWSPTDPNGVVWILHSAICDSEWLVLPTESDHPIITLVHLRNLSYSHECWFTNTIGTQNSNSWLEINTKVDITEEDVILRISESDIIGLKNGIL